MHDSQVRGNGGTIAGEEGINLPTRMQDACQIVISGLNHHLMAARPRIAVKAVGAQFNPVVSG